jgi:hypothetical protein
MICHGHAIDQALQGIKAGIRVHVVTLKAGHELAQVQSEEAQCPHPFWPTTAKSTATVCRRSILRSFPCRHLARSWRKNILKKISEIHSLVLEAAPGESVDGKHVGSVKVVATGRHIRPMGDALPIRSLAELANFQALEGQSVDSVDAANRCYGILAKFQNGGHGATMAPAGILAHDDIGNTIAGKVASIGGACPAPLGGKAVTAVEIIEDDQGSFEPSSVSNL